MTGATPPALVLDNGGHTVKLGLSTGADPSIVYPNAISKGGLVGDQIEAAGDFLGVSLRRPIDRGHVVNWDMQRALWARGCKAAGLPPPSKAGGLLVTAPPLALHPSLAAAEAVAFQELGVASLCIAPAPELAARCGEGAVGAGPCTAAAAATNTALVVDVGFSATTAAAVVDGRLLPATVRRVDLGGKALSALLREAITFRAVSLAGENYLAGAIKDAVAYVAADPYAAAADAAAAGKGGGGGSGAAAAAAAAATAAPPPAAIDRLPPPGIDPRVEYVLPDGVSVKGAGYARPVPPRLSRAERVAAAQAAAAAAAAAAGPLPTSASKKRPAPGSGGPPPENVIRLGLERFAIPEALFHPGDAGSGQAGVAEAAAGALAAAPAHLRPLLAARVLLVGGGAACPGFAARFTTEFTPLVPDDLTPPRVLAPADPALAAWRGGAALAADPAAWSARSLTKAEWQARGSAAAAWCAGGLVKS